MTTYIVDASVAIKWFVAEEGAESAAALLAAHRLVAPELIVIECANILWKKARKSEISEELALLSGRALERMDVELIPMRNLISRSLELAVELNHAAYDCAYLALAAVQGWPFVTADQSLARKIGRVRAKRLGFEILTLADAA